MPSSTWVHTSTVQDLIWKYQPKSILDIGPGFGRWGFLCRELLDVFRGRVIRSDWTVLIDCVEVFPQYITPIHDYVYDKIYHGCGLQFLEKCNEKYDLIVAGDVLEHFTKENGKKLIDEVYVHISKAAIFCVPLGDRYKQGKACGNEYEEHKAVWELEDFTSDFRFVQPIFQCKERIKGRPYCVTVMEKTR